VRRCAAYDVGNIPGEQITLPDEIGGGPLDPLEIRRLVLISLLDRQPRIA
jgi:hypothetical protein